MGILRGMRPVQGTTYTPNPGGGGTGNLLDNYPATHMVASLIHEVDNWTRFMNARKAEGIRLVWLHFDGWNFSYYNVDAITMLDAAHAAGLKVLIGYSCFSWQNAKSLMDTCWNHPALFWYKGKRCFAAYDYLPFKSDPIAGDYDEIQLQNAMVADGKATVSNGVYTKQYNLIVHGRVPYTYNQTDGQGNTIWISEYTAPNGIKCWSGTNNYYVTSGFRPSLQKMFDEWKFVDGYIPFPVDQPETSIKDFNDHIAEICHANNKIAFAGTACLYFAEGNKAYFYGLAGLKSMHERLLVNVDKYDGEAYATDNDYHEKSYKGAMVRQPENGFMYLPGKNRGFNYGIILYPVLSHEGIAVFEKPYIDAFRAGLTAPIITQRRLVSMHPLHPIDAPFESVIPPELAGDTTIYNQFDTDGSIWFSNSFYSHATNAINNIKTNIPNEYSRIYAGVHLPNGGQVKINSTVSAMLPAGIHVFDIPLGSFLGKPYYAIIENGVEYGGYSSQPVTGRCYPGGWQHLSEEINLTA